MSAIYFLSFVLSFDIREVSIYVPYLLTLWLAKCARNLDHEYETQNLENMRFKNIENHNYSASGITIKKGKPLFPRIKSK